MRLGVLSDTHGLLRQEVLNRLAGSDAILHGGDVNNQGILITLGGVAPVYVVRGNNDRDWADGIPLSLDFTLGGIRIFMTHKKRDLPDDLSPYDLVIYGHSHRYEEARQGRTVLLNPGSCGPRRFNQPITMALVDVKDGKIRVTRVDIENHTRIKNRTVNLKAQIETVIKETQKGRPAVEIAARRDWDVGLVEQIARLYVTHPGVDADGIMAKMGL
ncbi:MAG: metallophosphoesterase family protein [Clostridia bacterium]|nr:metallophosphoesterase family protein [Clostridia bacterium]